MPDSITYTPKTSNNTENIYLILKRMPKVHENNCRIVKCSSNYKTSKSTDIFDKTTKDITSDCITYTMTNQYKANKTIYKHKIDLEFNH